MNELSFSSTADVIGDFCDERVAIRCCAGFFVLFVGALRVRLELRVRGVLEIESSIEN